MDATEKQLENEFAVNVFSVIYMTQAVVGIGRMPPGGRIVNIGSVASKILVPPAVYSTTKAATDALTTLFAGEVSFYFVQPSLTLWPYNRRLTKDAGQLGQSRGITVNTIAPGPVPTDLSKSVLENPDGSPTELQLAMYQQTRAANRLGSPEDLADATLLLVSEKSRWITAQYIAVNGGITGTA